MSTTPTSKTGDSFVYYTRIVNIYNTRILKTKPNLCNTLRCTVARFVQLEVTPSPIVVNSGVGPGQLRFGAIMTIGIPPP
jgi:hypothetical protein